jgi:GDP-mannose 6-dehydrogenase
MRVSIFGLGYVGAVSSACFAKQGHEVIGVDVDRHKLDLIRAGRAPIVEKDLETYLQEAVSARRLRVTDQVAEAVMGSDISLLCVGTPSRENGDLRTDYLERVATQIGEAMRQKEGRHIVVIRSTVLPGTAERVVLPLLEKHSEKQVGRGFGLCVNPEFLRESTAIADFYAPPFTIVGGLLREDAETVAELYAGVDAPLFLTGIRTAEMIKYACNAFHALKITFANEIGMLCKAENIDSHEVMRVFCEDTKLNISPKYLLPGYAFGGSCLPKDLRALTYRAHSHDLRLPMMDHILVSNDYQIERVVREVQHYRKRNVGLFGLSFKPGTDDLRESPLVELAERLIGKGFNLKIYDANVSYAALYGSNKAYIEQEIPHIREILVENPLEVMKHAEVAIFGHGDHELPRILEEARPEQMIVDLARVVSAEKVKANYAGLYW